MNPHQIRGMAIQIDLRDGWKINKQPLLLKGNRKANKAPLVVTAGNDCWSTTLHAIRYYLQLTEKAQQAIVQKKYSREENKLLRVHRDYLMSNPPPLSSTDVLPSTGITPRQSNRQLNELIASQAARSTTEGNKAIAKVIRALPAWGTRQNMGDLPDNVCPVCLFRRTDAIIESVVALDDEHCLQCRQAEIQSQKASRKNNLMESKHQKQIALASSHLDKQHIISVNLCAFMLAALPPDQATELL